MEPARALTQALLLLDVDQAEAALRAALAAGPLAEAVEAVVAPAMRHLDATLGCRQASEEHVDLAAGVVRRGLAEARWQRAGAPRALAGVPRDERHTLAAELLAAALREAGWDCGPARRWGPQELVAEVRARRPQAVFLGATMPASLFAARDLVEALAEARWRGAVVIGGPLLARDPGLAARLGARHHAPDVRAAVRLAGGLRATRP